MELTRGGDLAPLGLGPILPSSSWVGLTGWKPHKDQNVLQTD